MFLRMDPIAIEVVLKNVLQSVDFVKNACHEFLQENHFYPGSIVSKFSSKVLEEYVEHIIISDTSTLQRNSLINFSQVHIEWLFYTLDKNEEQIEVDSDETGEVIHLAKLQVLPCQEYFNLWENLIYDTNVKEDLLKYAMTSMLFADRGVDYNIISCNRVVLLHGPPGTGKTSLCKALAQKLTVKLCHRFERGVLLEINSHSLFSKWFSESGKLVNKMFGRVTELVQNSKIIIFVLIDEIESLTHAREKSMSGVDPSDSIRVVNAVLTQIDQIRKHPNVIILTTSNMTGAIDLAFVDRADIKHYIGLPGPEAIYQIYHSCIEELFKAQIISPRVVILHNDIKLNNMEGDLFTYFKTLCEISKRSVGFSGRTLRKIPFLAHARYVDRPSVDINVFFDAMLKAVEGLVNDRKYFE
ncbi:hypothetical protein FQR65_LT02081 [Abscondita terminalis]|nr:hypothetical protein FQR65_LT02081 [Abscondita terminalis]